MKRWLSVSITRFSRIVSARSRKASVPVPVFAFICALCLYAVSGKPGNDAGPQPGGDRPSLASLGLFPASWLSGASGPGKEAQRWTGTVSFNRKEGRTCKCTAEASNCSMKWDEEHKNELAVDLTVAIDIPAGRGSGEDLMPSVNDIKSENRVSYHCEWEQKEERCCGKYRCKVAPHNAGKPRNISGSSGSRDKASVSRKVKPECRIKLILSKSKNEKRFKIEGSCTALVEQDFSKFRDEEKYAFACSGETSKKENSLPVVPLEQKKYSWKFEGKGSYSGSRISWETPPPEAKPGPELRCDWSCNNSIPWDGCSIGEENPPSCERTFKRRHDAIKIELSAGPCEDNAGQARKDLEERVQRCFSRVNRDDFQCDYDALTECLRLYPAGKAGKCKWNSCTIDEGFRKNASFGKCIDEAAQSWQQDSRKCR